MVAIPRLTILDNRDGTGAAATIYGSTAGSTNTVYTAQFGGDVTSIDFQSAGNRTGDGNLSIAEPTTGRYYAYVHSTLDGSEAVSGIVGFAVSNDGDLDDEFHYECCQAVQQQIQALALPNIDNDKVVILKLPFRAVSKVGPHGIIVTPQSETRQPVDDARDLVGYRIQVTLFQASNQDLEANLRDFLVWRERASKALSELSFAAPTWTHRTELNPGPVVLPQSFTANYDVGAFTLTCYTYQIRTNS